MNRLPLLTLTALLLSTAAANAATYYVDYETGADSNPGTENTAPWKHAPGDKAATATPKSATLAPGDTVKFKGGIIYRGAITIATSGEANKPITYDGNMANDWGNGKAIIDGSVPLEPLKQCTTPEEVFNNPNFKNIYVTNIPKGAKWNQLNLCQDLKPLAWAQDPNPADPNFQEDPKYFYKTETDIPKNIGNMSVRPVAPMKENAQRPLVTMFDNGNISAVIENIADGAIEISLEKPVTATEFSITPQPKYTNPKEMSFTADGKEILKVELKHNPDKKVEQRFKLDAPATFKKLTVKFISAHPEADGPAKDWGAVKSIAAYDADGKNVLIADRKSILRNEKVFTQPDANYFDNAFLALYARPAQVYYKRITTYNPADKTIGFETLTPTQAPYDKGGAFSIVNSPRHIDTPGEYALILDPEKDGTHKLYLWPPDGKPENLSRGQYGSGVTITGSYVTLQGFWVRKQGWNGDTAISARGKGTDLIIRNVKVSNLRGDGAGITTTLIDNVLVENCEVSDNAGHTRGIVLRNASNIVVRNCTLRRNSSTALDYYTVTNGVVQDCTVIENPGMHANGLTFYVGCKNILVERNTVRDGHAAITVQDGDGMIIRNNILEGGGNSPAIGLWSGAPYNNIVITNNVIRYRGEDPAFAAIYGGNANAKGYAIVNNIIDGFSGNAPQKADFHHNIFTRLGPTLKKESLGDNKLVEKYDDLVVDAAKSDYRLKPGSPAIDAGVEVTSVNKADVEGKPRAGAVDIGAYEVATVGDAWTEKADPHTFKFTFDGYKIAEPAAPKEQPYQMKFKKKENAQSITVKGVDKTAEGGGKVNLRPTKGGYISGWDQPNHWLEWTIDAPAAGTYEVVIEHGSEAPAKRELSLNGEPAKDLNPIALPATGAWTTFQKIGLEKPLTLKAGKNTLRFNNLEGSHNFKSIELIPVEE